MYSNSPKKCPDTSPSAPWQPSGEPAFLRSTAVPNPTPQQALDLKGHDIHDIMWRWVENGLVTGFEDLLFQVWM